VHHAGAVPSGTRVAIADKQVTAWYLFQHEGKVFATGQGSVGATTRSEPSNSNATCVANSASCGVLTSTGTHHGM
jgi:hypothetical protein